MRTPRERHGRFKLGSALLIAAGICLAVAGAPPASAAEKSNLDEAPPRETAGAVDTADLARQRGGRLSPGGPVPALKERDISVILWDENRHRGALGSTPIQLGQSHPFNSSTGARP